MKNCPFCGEKSINIYSEYDDEELVFTAYCLDCDCKWPIGTTRKEAKDLWNKRNNDENI